MNNTTQQTDNKDNLSPSGFKESIEQTEIILIDVTKMTVQNPPSAL